MLTDYNNASTAVWPLSSEELQGGWSGMSSQSTSNPMDRDEWPEEHVHCTEALDVVAKAKDLHPKLLGGMFFFFVLGATGVVTALLTSSKPIFESPHTVTGVIGLALLTVQSLLPTLFEGNPGLRGEHGLLGSSIMTLFLFHAAFGLQFGLSF
ncbi:hypothetical protein ZWY2020_029853 [Hordeum vulgare]|nr:hypothetical protein ZWY2020_029853 [Hordeum vulgare]